jgi:hypothetical protein
VELALRPRHGQDAVKERRERVPLLFQDEAESRWRSGQLDALGLDGAEVRESRWALRPCPDGDGCDEGLTARAGVGSGSSKQTTVLLPRSESSRASGQLRRGRKRFSPPKTDLYHSTRLAGTTTRRYLRSLRSSMNAVGGPVPQSGLARMRAQGNTPGLQIQGAERSGSLAPGERCSEALSASATAA